MFITSEDYISTIVHLVLLHLHTAVLQALSSGMITKGTQLCIYGVRNIANISCIKKQNKAKQLRVGGVELYTFE